MFCFDYSQGDSTEVWHNIPSLNKLSGQKSIKFFGWYFGKSMISLLYSDFIRPLLRLLWSLMHQTLCLKAFTHAILNEKPTYAVQTCSLNRRSFSFLASALFAVWSCAWWISWLLVPSLNTSTFYNKKGKSCRNGDSYKIWILPIFLSYFQGLNKSPNCFDVTDSTSKKVWDFFQIFWPFTTSLQEVLLEPQIVSSIYYHASVQL